MIHDGGDSLTPLVWFSPQGLLKEFVSFTAVPGRGVKGLHDEIRFGVATVLEHRGEGAATIPLLITGGPGLEGTPQHRGCECGIHVGGSDEVPHPAQFLGILSPKQLPRMHEDEALSFGAAVRILFGQTGAGTVAKKREQRLGAESAGRLHELCLGR